MRERMCSFWCLFLTLIVSFSSLGGAGQAMAADHWLPAHTVEVGGEYLFYIDGIAPPSRPAGPYTIHGSDKPGRVANILNSDLYKGPASSDDTSTWIAEQSDGGIALRSKTALSATGDPLYINIDPIAGTENAHASLGAKQTLELVQTNGKVRIGRTVDGAYWNLRYTNWGGDGWQAATVNQNAEFSVMRASSPDQDEFVPQYFAMRNVVDGGQYLFHIPGIVPTDMPQDSYTLFPEAKTATNGETRIAFTRYQGAQVKDDAAMWVAEAMGEGFALRALHHVDTNGNPLYLNIGVRETDTNLRVGMTSQKQELEIRRGANGVRIGLVSDGVWHNLRFTNPALPGWTAGTSSSSAEFKAVSWADSQEELDALRAKDIDPVDPSTPTERDTPKLTFAAISDMHIDYGFEKQDDPIREANRAALARIKAEENPDLLIAAGDFISNNGDKTPWPKEQWDRVTAELQRTLRDVVQDGQVIAVKGNHEYETGDGTYNASAWTEQVMRDSLGTPLAETHEPIDGGSTNQLGFHYLVDDMHVLGLNAPSPGKAEYSVDGIAWIRAELSKLDRNETIFFVGHYPMLDSRGMQAGYGAKAGGEELRQTLARYPNLIHLYGHDHGGDHAYIRKDTFERVTPYDLDGSVNHSSSVRGTGHVSAFSGSLSYYRNTHDPADWLSAAQPSVIQALMVYVYDDRVELEMKNYGDKTGDHKYMKPYVIPRAEVLDAPLATTKWTLDEAQGVIRNVPHRTTVKEFLAGFDAQHVVEVIGFDDAVVEDEARFIRSGMQVRRVVDGHVTDQRTVRVDKAADLGYPASIGTVRLDTSADDPMDVHAVEVKQLGDLPASAQLLAAMYDENGHQLALSAQRLTGSGSFAVKFSDDVKSKAHTWKVWAVESLATMRPLAEFASDTGERYPHPLVTNPDQPELIGVTDQRSHWYRIYPADVDSFDNAAALWSFAPSKDKGWFNQASHHNPSDIKVRYSEYYGDYVALTVASGGFFGVVDLDTQEPLYYWGGAKLENNPHSIELLSDGNVAVASSTGNTLSIYPASTGNLHKRPYRVEVKDAHSAVWDPQNELVYTHGERFQGYKVTGATSSPELQLDFDMELPDMGGHDLDPVRGMPSKYWVTNVGNLYWFDADTRSLTQKLRGLDVLERDNIKAISNFRESQRVVSVAPNNADDISWLTDEVYVHTPTASSYALSIKPSASDAYYKVRVWEHPHQ